MYIQTAEISQSKLSRFLWTDTRLASVWLIIRFYLGYEWFMAGWEKFNNPAWIGENAGAGVIGFLNGALQKTSGLHPDVSGWYAWFIQSVALPHPVIFSYLVTFGELAIGIGLIAGCITGIAAFFGAFLNFNFLFAGTVSINPEFIVLEILLILAWRVAGWYGLDRFVLPVLFRRRSN